MPPKVRDVNAIVASSALMASLAIRASNSSSESTTRRRSSTGAPFGTRTLRATFSAICLLAPQPVQHGRDIDLEVQDGASASPVTLACLERV